MQTDSTNKTSSLRDLLVKEPWKKLVMLEMEQVHGNELAVVNDQAEVEPGTLEKIAGVDALLSTHPDVGLIVRTADCLPILILHSSGLIGAVHAGRKGTEKGIFLNVLRTIRDDFGISHDLTVWFGPAICKDCYQIDRETDLHYDLYQKNMRQLKTVFPLEMVNLRTTQICTLEHPDYHSYRESGPGVEMNYFVVKQQTDL